MALDGATPPPQFGWVSGELAGQAKRGGTWGGQTTETAATMKCWFPLVQVMASASQTGHIVKRACYPR